MAYRESRARLHDVNLSDELGIVVDHSIGRIHVVRGTLVAE